MSVCVYIATDRDAVRYTVLSWGGGGSCKMLSVVLLVLKTDSRNLATVALKNGC